MKIEIDGARVNEDKGPVSGVSYLKLDEDSVHSIQTSMSERKPFKAKVKKTKKGKRCCCYCSLAIFLILALFAAGLTFIVVYFLPNYMVDRIFAVNDNRYSSINYSDLSKVKFVGRNFYLQKDGFTSKNIFTNAPKSPSLGLWHILPSSISAQFNNSNLNNEEDIESAMSQGTQPVTIYFHGSGGTRAGRAVFYNVISGMNFHTVAADYRGFGDSTGNPTESGLNDDAHTIYNYVKRKAGSKPIIVWSHSMGTAVATRLVAELSDKNTPPKALILSAPFNNLQNIFNYTAYAQKNPLRFLPWFQQLITTSMNIANLKMATDINVARVKCPIFIMHAKDDVVVPTYLTKKVVDAANQANKTLSFYDFSGDRNLGHRSVQLAQEVPQLIKKFLDSIK